jgi:hypothetical protein
VIAVANKRVASAVNRQVIMIDSRLSSPGFKEKCCFTKAGLPVWCEFNLSSSQFSLLSGWGVLIESDTLM